MTNPLSQRTQLWCDAWTAVASAANCEKSEAATRWANDALCAYDAKFITVGLPSPLRRRAPNDDRQRMRIISDGTGQGTIVYVGDKIVDDVRSLKIEFPSRSERVIITMEVNAEIAVFGVVAPGEVSLLHEGMRPNLPDRTGDPAKRDR